MKKELQDKAWTCLPKEVRDEIKRHYQSYSCNIYTQALFEDVFGEHNLASDTEPTEMLMVERKMVQRIYKMFYNEASEMNMKSCLLTNSQLASVRAQDLIAIFGDKCIPNK